MDINEYLLNVYYLQYYLNRFLKGSIIGDWLFNLQTEFIHNIVILNRANCLGKYFMAFSSSLL